MHDNPSHYFVRNAARSIALLGGILAVLARVDAAEELILAECDGLELRAFAGRLNDARQIVDVRATNRATNNPSHK